ncbi:MAG: PAS-domain containing protein [Micavibrio aeruginosavorus]|uniref:histidine kinase n=1 Tax=Micavibrio aeruginosavorus TaxID=349221 RepID=A0A7T5UJ61_9BACT|nr:MAG: PAS-domain containing protein [Micavibrio aeruginosavorus]
MSKAMWSIIAGHDIRFVWAKNRDDLYHEAVQAALIVMTAVAPGDENCAIAHTLAANPRITADLMAFAPNASVEERIRFLAHGFDYAFNNDFMKVPEFRKVLLQKIERGRLRWETRVLEEEYRRFRASLSASPDAFIVIDENNRLFFVSHHYRRAYPRSAARMVRGMPVMEAFDMACEEQGVSIKDPRYAAMRRFWERLEGTQEFDIGNGRVWRMKAAKLDDGQGTIVTTTDITHYLNQQRELQEAKQELEKALASEQEASALQKQFVNMVSHEFRTPLTIIDGHAQILHRKADEISAEDIRKRSKTIRSAVSRLISMMEGVLSSNMLKTGKLEIIPEPVDIRQFAADLCEDHAELAKDHRIDLDCNALPAKVNVDKKILSLILTNLLSNAIKYTKDSPYIVVKLSLTDNWLSIRVKDNGIGIPYDELPQVFERYFRASTATGIPGTGIGLSLVKDLVALYQGSLEVNSDVGKGTEFLIRLPVAGDHK